MRFFERAVYIVVVALTFRVAWVAFFGGPVCVLMVVRLDADELERSCGYGREVGNKQWCGDRRLSRAETKVVCCRMCNIFLI